MHSSPLLCKDLTQIVQFSSKHPLVVDLRQSVQFLTQGLESLTFGLILESRQLTEVGILRMEGVDADAVVGIAVLPGMCHIGIGDRQHLQDALFGLRTPVDHHFQITKVTHAKTTLAAE